MYECIQIQRKRGCAEEKERESECAGEIACARKKERVRERNERGREKEIEGERRGEKMR